MFDTEEYRLCTTGTDGDIANNGTIVPFGVLQNMATREIVNDPTYSTGLLRDLHRVQFELHGIGDEHPFRRMEQNHAMRVGAITGLDKTATFSASFQNDNLQVKEMIRDYQDLSYDMIYLRFHCRGNQSASENLAGSRLHTNLVMNQEVYYETGERDNRYHTKTYSIGASATSLHCQARRASQHAAKLII